MLQTQDAPSPFDSVKCTMHRQCTVYGIILEVDRNCDGYLRFLHSNDRVLASIYIVYTVYTVYTVAL